MKPSREEGERMSLIVSYSVLLEHYRTYVQLFIPWEVLILKVSLFHTAECCVLTFIMLPYLLLLILPCSIFSGLEEYLITDVTE